MARRRFFVRAVRNGRAELTGEAAEHLRRVLRAEAGQRFEISDNHVVYLAEIEELSKGLVLFSVIEQMEAESPEMRLILLASLIKFDRFEWIVEKATELGVEDFIPVVSERSETGLSEAAPRRLERWRRIALESSQQSRRARLPEIRECLPLERALTVGGDFHYLLEEECSAPPILATLPEAAQRLPAHAVCLLVGPEGGWTDRERQAAKAGGWLPVSLGPRILRSETAALAAVAVLVSAWREP